MPEKNILETIKLAHNYGSAFSQDQLHMYLRCRIPRAELDKQLTELLDGTDIFEKDGFLFAEDIATHHNQQREWSRRIFGEFKIYLKLLTKIPWIKFIGLTGSNAFESCQKQDDVDIFIVTEKNRLWISYLCIVLLSIVFRKRRILCVNYLVDDNNLNIRKKTYFTAIQLVQMIPVYNISFKNELITANLWIRKHLPNLNGQFNIHKYYLLDRQYRSVKPVFPVMLDTLNRTIYNRYYLRLSRKFPHYIGSSMLIENGLAKLHHEDHHDTYDQLNGDK